MEGAPAEVVAVAVRSGAADYYNLTVSVLHTYAVGAGQYVVHNCGDVEDSWQQVKELSNGETKAQFVSQTEKCEFCGRTFKAGERKIIEHAYPRSLALKAADSQEVYDQFVKDVDNFSVVCSSCNSIKGIKLPGNFRVVGGGLPGYEDMLSNKFTMIAGRYGFPNPLE